MGSALHLSEKSNSDRPLNTPKIAIASPKKSNSDRPLTRKKSRSPFHKKQTAIAHSLSYLGNFG
jgi:hypothetical protein